MPKGFVLADREHHYRLRVVWTGNRGTGTENYRAYGRDHTVSTAGKPDIAGSSDPAFRGDPARWNPEELLLASISTCHQLWYLHLCADSGIAVMSYDDEAEAVMVEDASGGGRFVSATLRPRITLRPGDAVVRAQQLHHEAHAKCFIANSLNFPVGCESTIVIAR